MADTAPYTREALIKDLVTTISTADGKRFILGAASSMAGTGVPQNVDRAYITEVTEHAISIVNQLYIKTT